MWYSNSTIISGPNFLPKWSSELNQLAYADNTIIFTSSNEYSIGKIMWILKECERESGQKINMSRVFSICIKILQQIW